jgi:hypothetical protein
MALVSSGIRVVCDRGNLGIDVVKPLVENKLGCEKDTFIFLSLQKLVCV